MAGPNSFLQSPFQSLIDRKGDDTSLLGNDAVKDAPVPELQDAPVAKVEQPKPVAHRAAPSPASLLPPSDQRPLFEATAAHYKVPVNVLMALVQQESSYNADAVNKESGASGPAQYIDATAKALRINAKDPNEAVPAAAKQLAERLAKGYSVEDAVKEHFAGPNRRLWGGKTTAYGAEVLQKAGVIGQELYGSDDAAPSAPTAGPEQNQFAPNRMSRADYEKEFRALNPRANDAAVKVAMTQYDQQKTDARKATDVTAKKLGPQPLPTAEQFFDARLNQRLQGEPSGVEPQLPGRQQPINPDVSAPRKRPGLVDQAKGDFGRGIDNLKALGYGSAGLAADAAGKDDEATRYLDEYVSIQNDIAKNNPATIGTYKNVKSLGDAGRYAIEAVAENLPMILPSLVTGGVGAQAAKVGAQRLVGGMIEAQVAKGVAREVAERQAAQFVAKRILLGSAAGAAPASIGMESGSIMGDIYQDTGKKAAGTSLAFGIPAGLLDTIEPVMALRKIAGPAVDELAGGIIKRLGVEAGKQFLVEAGTEGLQTVLEEAAKTQVSGKPLFTQELVDNVIDAALKGGIGGGVMGGVSQGVAELKAASQQGKAAPAPQQRIEPTLGEAPAPVAQPVEPSIQQPVEQPAPKFQADDQGFAGQIMGDDGQMYAINSQTGVADEPLGPLESAVKEAATQHAADPAPVPVVQEAPVAPDYASMSPADLRAAMRDVAQRAKDNPQQRKELMAERKTIEKEISLRGEQAAADSRPASEPLTAGPFDDMKAANKMMERYAKETGEPHEVVKQNDQFVVQPIGAKTNGIDSAGAARGSDGHGRSSGPADVVGRPDGKAGDPTGRGTGGGERPAGAGIDDVRVQDAGADRANADGAANAQPALSEPATAGSSQPYWKTNPFHAYQFPDQAKAEAFIDRKGADRNEFEAVQTGPVRWQVKPRAAPVSESFQSEQEAVADVSERPQVPEETPAPSSAESAPSQPATNASNPATEATGAKPKPAKPKRTPHPRELLNEKQDEIVRQAAAKLDARKAEKEAAKPEPIVMDEESYLAQKGASRQGFGDAALHRSSSNVSESAKRSAIERQSKLDSELAARREELRDEYQRKVADGEMRPPTSKENTDRVAQGDPDSEATQAARRLQEKIAKRKAAKNTETPQPTADAESPAPIQRHDVAIVKAKNSSRVDEKATLATLPPVPEGHARLFRAESPTTKFADVFDASELSDYHTDLPGQRYTPELKYADYYRDAYGKDAKIHYVDVPNEVAERGKMDDSEYVIDSGSANSGTNRMSAAVTGLDAIHALDERQEASGKKAPQGEGKRKSSHKPVNLVRMTNAPDFDWNRSKPNGTYASIADDPDAFTSPFADDYKNGRRVDLKYTPRNPLEVGDLRVKHARFKGSAGSRGESSAGIKALHASIPQDQFDAALAMSKEEVQAEIAARFPDVDSSAAYDAYEALEIWGAQEAKAKGHDIIIARDSEMAEFSEAVLLSGADGPKKSSKSDAKFSVIDGPADANQQAVDPTIQKLVDGGKIVLHDDASTLPGGKAPDGTQALTAPDGTIHIVKGASNAVVLHEAFHAGSQKLIGTKVWDGLMSRLGALYRQSEKSSGAARSFFDKARERVATAKAKDAVADGMEHEEFGAYAIEEYESAPATVRKWVDDLVGAVKAWALRRFGRQLGQVTPAQLSSLAKAALVDMRPTVTQADPTTTEDDRYSVSGSPQPRELTPPEQGLLRRLQGQIQDNLNRVKQVQERISDLTGVKNLAGADYYGAEANRPGRIASRKEDFQEKMLEPMLRRLAKAGHTPAQLSELLHAQHAEERNKAVAAINPEFPDGGSGLKTEDANVIIDRYKNSPKLLALADEARQISRETLDLKLAYGLITKAQHESLSISYDNYVPLKGDGEYGPKVKRATGHGERDEHILENIARDYEQALVVGEKNLARQSLVQMILQYPDDSLWTLRVPPKGKYVAGTVFSISKVGTSDVEANFTSQSEVAAWLEAKGPAAAQYEVNTSGGERVTEFTKPLQDNEVMVYIKGSPVRAQINDEALARQLRPLRTEMMNTVLQLMQKHNRYLSAIFTGYNPAFIMKNATRDAMTGTINATGNHGIVTAAKAWAKYPAAWAAMLQFAATGKEPQGGINDAMGWHLKAYRDQGGKVGASYMSDLEAQGKSLQRMFDDAKGAIKYAKEGKIDRAALIAGRKAIGGLAHAVEIVNQAFENAFRLALFAQLRDEGKAPAIAAQAAKNVTVNFDRKGTATPYLGAFYLFLNPAVQGTANLTKTLAKGEHKYQAWALTGMMAAAGFAAAIHGMDDDKDRWLGEKWDTRTKNLRIRIGSHTINIPLSQEYAPFYSIGVAMGEASRGESSLRSAAHVLSSFLDAYYPMQGAVQPGSDNYALDLLLAHVPTVGKVPAQIATNRNSFGNQVVPETDTTKNRPDNLKMNRGTKNSGYDAAAQGIAKAGEALGADKYQNDLSKVSPETLKLIYATYTGGLGRFIADSAGFGAAKVRGDEGLDSSDIPIIKDFVKPDSMNPIRTRYFDLADSAKDAISQFEQAKKQRDGAEIRAIASDPERRALLGLSKMIQSTNKVQGIFADQAVSINADKTLTLGQKREQLKAIEDRQEEIYRKGIAVFKK